MGKGFLKKWSAMFLIVTLVLIWGVMYLTSITSVAATYSGGSGSSSDPYLISSEADLNALADFVNNGGSTTGMYFKQTGNITIVSAHKAIGQFEYYSLEEDNTYFDGVYEGNNCTITASGTLASSDTAYTQGIFGCVGSNGVVKNLSVSADIDGDGLVGGIVGYNLGYIENCHFSGSISGDYVWHPIRVDNGDGTTSLTTYKVTAFGGIAGRNYGSIIDCTNSGKISGGYNENGTGGIAGYSHGGTIEGCSNSGEISGARIGGIVGNVEEEINSSLTLSTTITDCENTGDILGGNTSGGIVGYNLLGIITDCKNTGTIGTNSYGSYGVAGGIAGYNRNITISNCYNAGAVSSGNLGMAGGIAGQLLYSNVSQCINNGTVAGSGSYYIGGAAGWMHGGTISETYNSGAISGVGFSFGGVLGATNCYDPIEGQTYDDTNNNTIEYCYNTGDITVTQTSGGDSFNAGGIVGCIYDPVSNEVNYCYNIGDISGTTVKTSVPFCAGGIVGKAYDNYSTYSVIRIVYCYYDNSRSVSTDGVENTSVSAIGSIAVTTGSITQVSTTGLSSAQMTYTATTSMTGFSSSNKWTFNSGYYPVLAYDSPYDVEDELIGPNTYTITFDANGGTGSMSSMTAYDGVTLVLPDSTFESPSEDLVFSGWGRTADSLIGSMSLLFYGDTTVYAIWGNSDLTGIATITGTPYIGNTLTANIIESNHTGEFTYRWFYKVEDGYSYLGTGETYTITADDVGKAIMLEVYCDERDGFLYSEEITVLEDAITEFSVKESWVYGETDNGFIVTSNSGTDPVFTYSDEENGIYTDTVPTDVGTYWVKASIVADDGMVRAEKTISFEIKEYATEEKVTDLEDWTNTDKLTLEAPEGYTISLTNGVEDEFKDSITVNTIEGENVEIIYYLRSGTGAISTAKTFIYSNDQTDPTALISVVDGTWTTLLKTITFGWFSTDIEAITIQADDKLSGVDSIKYFVGDENTDIDSIKWESYYDILGNKPTLNIDDTYVIYARVADNAGNETIISSDGIVIYSDSTLKTDEVTYTKTTTDDVVIDINFNGNTLEKVTIDDEVLAVSNYAVGSESITIDGDYLDTLDVQDYAIVISFKPQGVDYNQTAVGEAPEAADVMLHVIKAEQNITIEEVIDVTYGDDAFDLVVNTVKGDAELTYTVEGDAVTVDENGTVTVVGSGVVTIIVTALATDNYNSGTAYVTFEVAKKAVSVVIDDQEIVRGMDIPELTGTVEGDLESDVVTPTYSVTADNMVAGEYEITMTNAEDYAYYDIAITAGTLTITTGYTVTFDGEAMTDVVYGTVLEESIPTKDGYTFVAWVTADGESYDFATPVTGDLELTSTWDEIVVEDEVVDTADHANLTMWYVVLFTSFLGVAVLEIRRRRA